MITLFSTVSFFGIVPVSICSYVICYRALAITFLLHPRRRRVVPIMIVWLIFMTDCSEGTILMIKPFQHDNIDQLVGTPPISAGFNRVCQLLSNPKVLMRDLEMAVCDSWSECDREAFYIINIMLSVCTF